MTEIPWFRLRQVRRRIAKLEAELELLYEERTDIMAAMFDQKIGQREIGAYWGVSNPRVYQILLKRRRTTVR
jgi:DNA-directed RNA polymerase specialized sigma subunit